MIEDIGGDSLAHLLAERPLPLETFFDVALHLAEALARLHERRIIHKDINPSNIVLNPKTGELRLIDFGSASLLPREDQQVSSPNGFEGTLPYMSPEQTGRMNRGVDWRSDLYSLGATFYHLLTQRPPFEARDALELVHCHLARPPVPPHVHAPSVPQVLSRLVLKLLARTAEERYRSAHGLVVDLAECRQRLLASGGVPEFELGREDLAERFQVPQRLYGREAEVELLLRAFERVSQGPSELLLLRGYAGIGKSALVHEVHKPVTREHGYFAKSKFDQFQRNQPFTALARTLSEQPRLRSAGARRGQKPVVWYTIMSRRPLWEEIYKRFDPELPAPAHWRVERDPSPVGEMLTALRRSFATPHLLLTGPAGTGKSTVLRQVAEEREEQDLVVYLDLARYFAEAVKAPLALERIDAWEICMLAGLALVARLQERMNVKSDLEMVERFATAWQAVSILANTPASSRDLDLFIAQSYNLGKVLLAAAGMEPGITGAVGGWSLPLGRFARATADQDQRIQELLSAINLLVSEVQQKHRRVLFIIDGLDRIRDPDRAKVLLVDSQPISQLACPAVVCAPLILHRHLTGAGVHGFKTAMLLNVPVLDRQDPSHHGPGVDFFRKLYERRVAGLEGAEGLMSKELLGELAYRSGGQTRDFVWFIRTLAEVAWDQDAQTATPELVKKVLDYWRRRKEMGLHSGHIQLLEQVMRDPKHRLPEATLAHELIDYQTLLPYHDESEWYYPHPLLTIDLLAEGQSASGSEVPHAQATRPVTPGYLSHISIEDIRSLHTLHWPMPPEPGWHVLIGDNGAGKSSALRAIAAALLGDGRHYERGIATSEASPDSALALRIDFSTWLRLGKSNGTVSLMVLVTEADGSKVTQEHRLQISANNQSWSSSLHTSELFTAGFGPFRRFSGGDTDYERQFSSLPRVTRHLSLFDERISLTEVLRWLKDLQFKALMNGFSAAFLDRVRTFINQEGFLPNNVKLQDITPDAVRFVDADGALISTEELSDGYRSILSLTMELIRQLAAHYGPGGVFGEDARTVVAPGIVLIDEADAHLHPTWQQEIGLRLKRLFPRIQFVVTTHSPLVCQAADTVFRLPRPGTGEEGRTLEGVELDRLRYGNVLDAYGTGAFGQIELSAEGMQRLERLTRLNRKEIEQGLSAAEEQEQERLRAIFSTETRSTERQG